VTSSDVQTQHYSSHSPSPPSQQAWAEQLAVAGAADFPFAYNNANLQSKKTLEHAPSLSAKGMFRVAEVTLVLARSHHPDTSPLGWVKAVSPSRI